MGQLAACRTARHRSVAECQRDLLWTASQYLYLRIARAHSFGNIMYIQVFVYWCLSKQHYLAMCIGLHTLYIILQDFATAWLYHGGFYLHDNMYTTSKKFPEDHMKYAKSSEITTAVPAEFDSIYVHYTLQDCLDIYGWILCSCKFLNEFCDMGNEVKYVVIYTLYDCAIMPYSHNLKQLVLIGLQRLLLLLPKLTPSWSFLLFEDVRARYV